MEIYEIFFLLFLTYYQIGPMLTLINYLLKKYPNFIDFINFINFINFIEYYNKHIYPNYWENEPQLDIEISTDNNSKIIEEKHIQRYEDKYLDDIRRINNEWEFTKEDLTELPTIFCKFFNMSKENIINEMKEIQTQIFNLEKEINTEQIEFLKVEYEKKNIQINTEEGLEELRLKCEEQSKQEIINRRIDKLANCYVMEKTPIGNVLMIYDKNLSKFKYYSDSTMPYRYLEVVGRKYVKLFNCRPIFIDMEEELKLFEQKLEKDQEVKKKKEEENLKLEELKLIEIKKKNVFAKFKSYNKETPGKMIMNLPPKNNIIINSVKDDEKFILKEKSNCYCFDGKISNFNFLNKIEKKVFNKKLGFTFADFKKINLQNNN